MRVLRTYQHTETGAWYALVEFDDGALAEMKAHEPLSEEDWLGLAAEWRAGMERHDEPDITVECEDGARV